MRAFCAIVVKDLKVRFSSPMELVFFLVLPLVFTVVLSGASMGGSGGAKPAPLVLLQDSVGSAQSRGFAVLLGTMPGIRVRTVSDPTALIATAEPDLLLTLTPAASAQSALPFDVSFRLSPWRGSAAETARRVGQWLLAGSRAAAGSSEAAPAATSTPQAASVAAPADPAAGASSVDAPSSAATGNAGQIITWVLVPLLGLGAGFITERRRGTMRRVLTTPAPRGVVTAASVAAETLGALVQIGLLVAFGAAAFRLPWFSHPAELLFLSVAFCIAGAAIGAFLGTVCRTSRQAGSLGLALAMVLAVFGGCWYPSALFPSGMRRITGLDPAGWAMDGFLAVLSPAAGTGPALRSAALLLGFGAVLFLLVAAASRGRRAGAA